MELLSDRLMPIPSSTSKSIHVVVSAEKLNDSQLILTLNGEPMTVNVDSKGNLSVSSDTETFVDGDYTVTLTTKTFTGKISAKKLSIEALATGSAVYDDGKEQLTLPAQSLMTLDGTKQ